jgi:hypothetical protein
VINKSLEKESDGKKVRKLRSQASKLKAEKPARYEDQEAKLGRRNSCSRTDADATIIKRGKAFIPETYTGEGAYGNQYNWTLLAQHNIGNYLKYGSFHREQKRAFREDKFHRDNMRYDGTKDEYICPAERVLAFRRIAKRRLAGNQDVKERVYECGDCGGCPHAKACKIAESRPNEEIKRIEKHCVWLFRYVNL